MDLIFTNDNLQDVGVVMGGLFDYEASTDKDKCVFELNTTIADNVLALGDYVYISGTEYGGRVDMQKVDTAKGVITSSGRTWRGILGSKILEPPTGQAYYTVTGDLNANLADIIEKIDLDGMFAVDDTVTTTKTYTFSRYIDAYRGIMSMLSDNGYKLRLIWRDDLHKVMLSAVPIVDYTNASEISSDLFDFIIQKSIAPVNHMIGLGSGELTSRQIVHKYLQQDGTIGDTQYYFDDDEIVAIYNYPNVESLADLERQTTDALKEAISGTESVEVDSNTELNADLGDKFTAHDITTGLSITQYVIDKIVNIENDTARISYDVGEAIK